MAKEKRFGVWMRLGVSLDVTKEEMDILLSASNKANETLRRILAERRFAPNGDSYIPETEVEEINNAYGTDYETGDYGFDV